MDQTLHYVVIQLDLQQVNGILIFGIFFNSTIPANGTKLIKMTWDLNGLNVAILFSIDIVSRTLFGNINLIKTFSEWSIPNRKFTSIHRNAIYNVNEQHMKITPYSFPSRSFNETVWNWWKFCHVNVTPGKCNWASICGELLLIFPAGEWKQLAPANFTFK